MPAAAALLLATAAPGRAIAACNAESAAGRDVQVNCLAEDDESPQNTQSETSVAVRGNSVVVVDNDTRLLKGGTGGVGVGYSVSTDGGRHFRDMGGFPTRRADGLVAQPYADPTVVATSDGFYATALAFDEKGVFGDSEIAFYRLAPGRRRFRLVSTLADVGSLLAGHVADKAYLTARDPARDRRRFFVSWSRFSPGGDIPIMLSDSRDGRSWRTKRVSGPDACDSGSQPLVVGRFAYVAWWRADDCSENLTHGSEDVARVAVATGDVVSRARVGTVHGVGDATTSCAQFGGGSGVWEVIRTRPGHVARLIAEPSIARDPNGTLYVAWNDRPGGVGGSPANATRIYLASSADGRTWSAPRVVSGPRSTTTMSDRFQPALAADRDGLHATWYERVPHSPADWIREDRAELTLRTGGHAPRLLYERPLSATPFPIVRTKPQQDPSGEPDCYMGEYNGITAAAGAVYAAWGDNRNVVATTNRNEHQPDVFLRRWAPRRP